MGDFLSRIEFAADGGEVILDIMTELNRGRPEREFSSETKKTERSAANNACRICGKPRELEPLQFAHILSHSQNEKWKRNGTDPNLWNDDKYVASVSNCLLLCLTHHSKVDSERGLEICTVKYLESLKINPNQCTALISKGGEIRRCRKLNGRLNPGQSKGNGYRCHLHLKGGLEEELVARTGWTSPKKNPAETGGCILL